MTIENILKNIITSIEDDSFEIYDVIMEFARQNQHIYIDFLHEFKNDENPFQQLDSKLEKQISSICSDLGYIDEAIEAEKLKNFIIQRNITHLCHFTRLENLESILKNGICSKKELINNKAQFVFNDESRLDGYPNAISTSISFPNYTCFYGMRKRSNAESDWVVILLKPSVLWEKECVFFISNAASKPAKRHFEECGSSICDLFEEESSLVPFSSTPNC
jgi:hypothetical protein